MLFHYNVINMLLKKDCMCHALSKTKSNCGNYEVSQNIKNAIKLRPFCQQLLTQQIIITHVLFGRTETVLKCDRTTLNLRH